MAIVYARTTSNKKKRNLVKTAKQKREDAAAWGKMLKSFGGNPKERLDKSKLPPLKSTGLEAVLAHNAGRSITHFPSITRFGSDTVKEKPKYSGEMAEREKAAQKEVDRKRTMIAPVFNKGPAQYIGGYDPKDLGKKT